MGDLLKIWSLNSFHRSALAAGHVHSGQLVTMGDENPSACSRSRLGTEALLALGLAGKFQVVCGWLANSYCFTTLLGGRRRQYPPHGVDLAETTLLSRGACGRVWWLFQPDRSAADRPLGNSVGANEWSVGAARVRAGSPLGRVHFGVPHPL